MEARRGAYSYFSFLTSFRWKYLRRALNKTYRGDAVELHCVQENYSIEVNLRGEIISEIVYSLKEAINVINS